MFLTPHEQEKLMIYVVADLARRRDCGLRLNVAEATRGRDGKGVTELMELGGLRRAVGFNGLANGSTATARPARRAAPGRASKG